MSRILMIALIHMYLSVSGANDGIALNDIQGTWLRVGDGCRLLAEEEMLNLPYSGGGNSARRRMVLQFTETEFIATSFPSLKCEDDFQNKEKVEFENQNIVPICHKRMTNQGALKWVAETSSIDIQAEQCPAEINDNPWGCGRNDFAMKKVGSALILHSLTDYDACGTTPFYIYFIPYPMM